MKDPKIIYFLISIFCIFAIIAGIYAQFIDANHGGIPVADVDNQNVIQEENQETIKENFNSLFINTLNLGSFDTTGIQKINNEKDIVYTIFEMNENTENYEINMHIPVININSDLADLLNQTTQADFVNKANDIMQEDNPEIKTLYNIDYTAYVNNNILSVVIRSTLKEGDSAQRVIVQTYNYNLDTNEKVSLVELATIKRKNTDEINSKIMNVVTKANEEAETLQNMGYNEIFVRDLSSNIYNVNNAGTYFLGPNGELYIIYAYGNNQFTSEMDIVLIK